MLTMMLLETPPKLYDWLRTITLVNPHCSGETVST
jgi:hypothetical protein